MVQVLIWRLGCEFQYSKICQLLLCTRRGPWIWFALAGSLQQAAGQETAYMPLTQLLDDKLTPSTIEVAAARSKGSDLAFPFVFGEAASMLAIAEFCDAHIPHRCRADSALRVSRLW